MSNAKFRAQLLELVDSDSEDGLSGGLTPLARPAPAPSRRAAKVPVKPSKKSNTMPAKKGVRGRPAAAAAAVTKPAPKASTRAAASEQGDEDSRTALVETSTNAQPKTTTRGRKRAAAEEEAEDEVMVEAPPPKTSRGRPKKNARENAMDEIPNSQPPPPARAQRGRKAAAPKRMEAVVEEEPKEEEDEDDDMEEEATEIPETQPQRLIAEEEEDELEELPAHHSYPPRTGRNAAQTAPSSAAKRPMHGGAAQTDTSDPALRRRLGEMTQKYESLELKYQNLREVAVKEAESNFDKLKKQADEKSKAADDLITSLKAELAAQKEASKETLRLKRDLETTSAKATALQTTLTELTTSLSESKTEIKALTMKLSAARTAEAAAAAKASSSSHHHPIPGSAIKGGTSSSTHRSILTSNSEAVRQATASSQKREDLYADLTGLIIRTIGDDYDCLQTGRNGTLHFKLREVGAEEEQGDGDVDGEPQLRYMPQLDPDRDRGLMEILPNFLVDEIEFPRSHVDKFYARVVKALTGAP